MNTAMLLRIVNNGLAVAFVFLYVPIFDKVMEIFTRQKVSKNYFRKFFFVKCSYKFIFLPLFA